MKMARKIAAQLRETRLADPEGLVIARNKAWRALMRVHTETEQFPGAKMLRLEQVASRFERANPSGSIPEARVLSMLQGIFSKTEGVDTRTVLHWLQHWTEFYNEWRASEMSTGAYASGRTPDLGVDPDERSGGRRRGAGNGSAMDRLGASVVWTTDDDDTVLDARLFVHAIRLAACVTREAGDVYPDPHDGGDLLARSTNAKWRECVGDACASVMLSRLDSRMQLQDLEKILCLPVASHETREEIASDLRTAFLRMFPDSDAAEDTARFQARRMAVAAAQGIPIDPDDPINWGDPTVEEDEEEGEESKEDGGVKAMRKIRELRLADARERKRITASFRRRALTAREVDAILDGPEFAKYWRDPLGDFLRAKWSSISSIPTGRIGSRAVLSEYEAVLAPALCNVRTDIKMRAARLYRVVCIVSSRKMKLELLWWKAKAQRRRRARDVVQRMVARWRWTSVLLAMRHMQQLAVEYHAALTIQCCYRQYNARVMLHLLVIWSRACKVIQRWFRQRLRWLILCRRAAALRHAVLLVQRRLHRINVVARFRRAAEEVYRIEMERRADVELQAQLSESAVVIQRAYRIYVSRKELDRLWEVRAARLAAFEEEQRQLAEAEKEVLLDRQEMIELVQRRRKERVMMQNLARMEFEGRKRARLDRAEERLRRRARERNRRREKIHAEAVARLKSFGEVWNRRIVSEMKGMREGLTLLIHGRRPTAAATVKEQEVWESAAKQWMAIAQKLARERGASPVDCMIDAKRIVVSHMLNVHHLHLLELRGNDRNVIANQIRAKVEKMLHAEHSESEGDRDKAQRTIAKFCRQVNGAAFARFLFRTEWEKGYDLHENRFYYQSFTSGYVLWDHPPRILLDTDIDLHNRWDPYFTRRGVPFWFHPRGHIMSWEQPPLHLISGYDGVIPTKEEEATVDPRWHPVPLPGHECGRVVRTDPTAPGWVSVRASGAASRVSLYSGGARGAGSVGGGGEGDELEKLLTTDDTPEELLPAKPTPSSSSPSYLDGNTTLASAMTLMESDPGVGSLVRQKSIRDTIPKKKEEGGGEGGGGEGV